MTRGPRIGSGRIPTVLERTSAMPKFSQPSRLRTPPLAFRNVLHARGRSLVAVAGIGYATVMVFLQLGFLEAVKVTASVNYDQLDFCLLYTSPSPRD